MNISRRDALRLFVGMSASSLIPTEYALATGYREERSFTQEMSGDISLDRVSEALSEVALQSDDYCFAGVDFSNLSIGSGIPTYTFDGNAFELSDSYYPIFCNGLLAFWSIENAGAIQITDGLVSEINNAVSIGSEMAIIYDRTTAYLYNKTDSSLISLLKYEPIDGRGTLDSSDIPSVETSVLREVSSLPIGPSPRGLFAQINVPTVLQPDGSSLCWAASCASVANKLLGSSYTCVGVAQIWYGAISYDRPLYNSDVPRVLNTLGVSSYSFVNSVPSVTTVYNNLSSGYPVIANWQYSAGKTGHTTVVRGITQSDNLAMMDPLGAVFTTANRSGSTWGAKNAGSGAYMTMISRSARYA